MKIEYIDLKSQYNVIKNDINTSILSVIDNTDFIMGKEVEVLEKRLADYCGRKHCISVSNGTDALIMALMCSGIKSGDVVFTTAFSFFATSEVIALLGAKPVFVDINPNTYNMDEYCLTHAIKRYKKLNNANLKAVITVDLFGLCANYNKISEICEEHNLDLIEDAAQSYGANYYDKKACSFGRYATTSFFPAKPLGCYGDGGAIFCDDDDDAQYLRSIRVHGKSDDKYNNIRVGLNARLDTIQAAVLNCKLNIFNDELKKRIEIADKYNELLKNHVKVPYVNKDLTSTYAQYTIAFRDMETRDYVKEYLKDKSVPTNIYYTIPLHKQKAHGMENISMPNAEIASKTVLSLPMHPYLKQEEIVYICDKIKEALDCPPA